MSEYPGIGKLLELVNTHESTTHNLDSAFIMGYNRTESGLNFHNDGEKLIDQSGSIATVSVGQERRMEFCRQGGPREPEYGFVVNDGDLAIMKPGCQQNLVHRICPGAPETVGGNANNWRFSISFRKVTPPSDDKEISFDLKMDNDLGKSNNITKRKICVIAGDSYSAGLDPIKLGRKNRKIVKNISKGGAKIDDVSKQLDEFFLGNKEGVVDKVFICVGTNDIRFCEGSGVKHLRNKLLGLVDKVKLLFPGAKVWFQSLLPLPVQNSRTIDNVESYNKMLYEVCSNKKVFYLNCFSMFLVPTRNGDYLRYEPLFCGPTNTLPNIHPNNRGLALIARKYLSLIHNRKFDPLAYNSVHILY